MTNSKLAGIALAAAVIASPVLAQTTGNSTTMGAPATTSRGNTTPNTMGSATPGSTIGATTPTTGLGSAGPNTMGSTAASSNANSPSNRNPVLTDSGDVRASKVIGSSVYNDKDEKIGSIDDIILGKDNKPAQVVVSVGGFLGMGAKLVSVPYDKLQFGDTNRNSDNRVMMPGATRDSLNGMQAYHYASAS